MNLERQILEALEYRPLSLEELLHVLPEAASQDIQKSLYELSEQKMWVVKLPAIGGGCKTCACEVTFKWRLTIGGRQQLKVH